MRSTQLFKLGILLTSTLAVIGVAVPPQAAAQQANESSRTVAGGGVFALGWTGKIDASEEKAG